MGTNSLKHNNTTTHSTSLQSSTRHHPSQHVSLQLLHLQLLRLLRFLLLLLLRPLKSLHGSDTTLETGNGTDLEVKSWQTTRPGPYSRTQIVPSRSDGIKRLPPST